MDVTFFDGHDELLGKIVQRAPAVGAKMWCLSLCFVFCLSRSESGAPCGLGVHSSNTHCVAVYCPISTRFSAFYRKGFVFQKHYIVLILVGSDATNSEKCRSKIAKIKK